MKFVSPQIEEKVIIFKEVKLGKRMKKEDLFATVSLELSPSYYTGCLYGPELGETPVILIPSTKPSINSTGHPQYQCILCTETATHSKHVVGRLLFVRCFEC